MNRDRRRQLGALIRQTRKARGWSQGRLGQAANLSVTVVGHIERGGRYQESSLIDVATALGWTPSAVEAFLKGDDGAIKPPVVNTRAATRSAPRSKDEARSMILEATLDELFKFRTVVAELRGAEEADRFLREAMELREQRAAGAKKGEAG